MRKPMPSTDYRLKKITCRDGEHFFGMFSNFFPDEPQQFYMVNYYHMEEFLACLARGENDQARAMARVMLQDEVLKVQVI